MSISLCSSCPHCDATDDGIDILRCVQCDVLFCRNCGFVLHADGSLGFGGDLCPQCKAPGSIIGEIVNRQTQVDTPNVDSDDDFGDTSPWCDADNDDTSKLIGAPESPRSMRARQSSLWAFVLIPCSLAILVAAAFAIFSLKNEDSGLPEMNQSLESAVPVPASSEHRELDAMAAPTEPTSGHSVQGNGTQDAQTKTLPQPSRQKKKPSGTKPDKNKKVEHSSSASNGGHTSKASGSPKNGSISRESREKVLVGKDVNRPRMGRVAPEKSRHAKDIGINPQIRPRTAEERLIEQEKRRRTANRASPEDSRRADEAGRRL
jgi:hypothetical protein